MAFRMEKGRGGGGVASNPLEIGEIEYGLSCTLIKINYCL